MANKKIEHLVVDTTAFIQNAPLQDVAENIITCSDVVDEIKNKRQLKRLAVLPYNLIVKDPFPENVKVIIDFAKMTGDYPSLSVTDIRVMALTYQLEKENVGTVHLRTKPVMQKSVNLVKKSTPIDVNVDLPGFYMGKDGSRPNKGDDLVETFEDVMTSDGEKSDSSEYDTCSDGEDEVYNGVIENGDNVNASSDENKQFSEEHEEITKNIDDTLQLENSKNNNEDVDKDGEELLEQSETDDDDEGWITPSNIKEVEKKIHPNFMDDKTVVVGCMTTDFAMQNVLKQMNLNVCALDGRVIRHLRTFILRCYACFKTTSVMTKQFCPTCGNNTLKKVAVSLDENGKLQIHINIRRPLSARGKKFSMPTFKGGKHPNNPIIVEDQRMPHNRPSRLARSKIDPLDHDYVPGFSPFVTRDVYSKSAQLGIRPGQELKHWMRQNPNESSRRRRKK